MVEALWQPWNHFAALQEENSGAVRILPWIVKSKTSAEVDSGAIDLIVYMHIIYQKKNMTFNSQELFLNFIIDMVEGVNIQVVVKAFVK